MPPQAVAQLQYKSGKYFVARHVFRLSSASVAHSGRTRWQELPLKQESIVIRFRLIEATTLSLVLAVVSPAMAGDMQQSPAQHSKGQVHPARVYASSPNDPSLPVENALRWGYSQGYSNYPSGWGGLYGDGRYPGNTVSNPGNYNTLR
jgi:hypothetical protein